MQTLFSLRRQLRTLFVDAAMPDPEYDAMALLQDCLSLSFTQIHVESQMQIADDDVADILSRASRIAAGEPLQYVTHKAYFGPHVFYVDPSVLIPRPETYELVQKVCSEVGSRPCRVLDIGTGSGCISISVAAHRPQSQVFAVDVSDEALRVARRNSEQIGVDVSFARCDILTDRPEGVFDVVVSNPPYVRECEKAEMLPLVLEHEPHLALFVSDSDPLIFYRTIARHCRSGLLCAGGKLFFEINEALRAEMCEMLAAEGFADIEVLRDAYDKDRMVVATLG